MLKRIIRRQIQNKSKTWNKILRQYPTKVDKIEPKPMEFEKKRTPLKIRPLLNSRYVETSEMTFHEEPIPFNISKPNEIPEELKINMTNFEINVDVPENSKFMKVAIVGPINAGKSSLFNKLVGKEISAVSTKQNTTYENMEGFVTSNEHKSQIIFYDVPGFARITGRQRSISERLQNQKGLRDVDKIMLVVDGNIRPKETWIKDIIFLKALADSGKGVILVVNKMDLIFNKRKLSDTIEMFENYLNFESTYMISCQTGFGIEQLLTFLHNNNLPGKWLHSEKITSPYSEQDLIYQIIKSAFFDRLYKEIPYLLNYQIREFHFKNTHIKMILQANVSKKYQIPMILGKNGNNIRAIQEDIQTRLAKLYNRVVEVGIIVGVGKLMEVDYDRLSEDHLFDVEESIKIAKDTITNRTSLPKNFASR